MTATYLKPYSETQYAVLVRGRTHHNRDYIATEDSFDTLDAADDYAVTFLRNEEAHQFDAVMAIVETNLETGETKQIRDRLAIIHLREVEDQAQEDEERQDRLYGNERDGSAFGVNQHCFL